MIFFFMLMINYLFLFCIFIQFLLLSFFNMFNKERLIIIKLCKLFPHTVIFILGNYP